MIEALSGFALGSLAVGLVAVNVIRATKKKTLDQCLPVLCPGEQIRFWSDDRKTVLAVMRLKEFTTDREGTNALLIDEFRFQQGYDLYHGIRR